ncbi:Retrovirus-related Pol polyprotein from transposon RE1 [Vitis vinifera]|uniref:Retrovirus-related Pol polyprotein from transposon RE1 n=1 Tax=Vitis vinifera TaxID=29760 RepID=A0A438K3L4_VITVI|nr:Retrovirus-related Pol polyprotein from transposon RE1 [Vitis vinifera]
MASASTQSSDSIGSGQSTTMALIILFFANGFEDFIDGSSICPDKELSSGLINPAFVAWRRQDRTILSWLYSSLTPAIMAQIIGHNSSHFAWNALEKTFSSSSRARIMQLRLELQSTKKGSLSMIDYITKVKRATDSLAAIGEPVSEQDQVMNLLGGLGSDYNAVVTAINIRDDKISIEAVHSMLLAFEHRLEQQSSIEQFSPISANYASSSNSRGGGRRYNGGRGQNHTLNTSNYTYRGRGRGGRYGQNGRHNSNSSEKPQCQLCGKFGHTVQICYHRFDISYQSAQSSNTSPSNAGNPNSIPAMVASSNNLADDTCSSPYTGTDKVTIGNGKHLSISNTGSHRLLSDSHSFHLKKVFHVPFISANLISVAKFCSDNNALIEFRSNSFFVKDLHTKKVLAQGQLENGLYRFPVLNSKKVAFVGATNSSTFYSHNSSIFDNKVKLWHHRLGHASTDILVKSHRLPTHLSLSCTSKPLELVHTDLWGPAPVKSTSGARYFILFLDDYSRLIMVVSSDPSRRFFSKQAFFIDFLARITQLRMGELNESIGMLLKLGWPCWLMPPYQWSSSNMLSRQLHFSSIECQVSHKLQYRSVQSLFLGYSLHNKGFLCLDFLTGRVYITPHVVFDEGQFPLAKTHPLSPTKDTSTDTLTPAIITSFPSPTFCSNGSHTSSLSSSPSTSEASNSIPGSHVELEDWSPEEERMRERRGWQKGYFLGCRLHVFLPVIILWFPLFSSGRVCKAERLGETGLKDGERSAKGDGEVLSWLMRQECFDWKDDSDYKEERSPRNRSCMLIWYGVSYIHNQALDPYSQIFDSQVRSREIFPTSILFHLRL